MSIGLIIICRECRTSVYVGTRNSMTDEGPAKVAAFLWKHTNHELVAISEGHPMYYEQVEDDLMYEDGTSMIGDKYIITYELSEKEKKRLGE